MKTFTFLLPIALLVLGLSACGPQAEEAPTDQARATEHSSGIGAGQGDAVQTAEILEGVQVVAVEAGPNGYEPGKVSFVAGVPARIIFTRTTPSPCLAQVMLPSYQIGPVDLPMNQPVAIDFTPSEAGEFAFACGMDMQHGLLLVRS